MIQRLKLMFVNNFMFKFWIRKPFYFSCINTNLKVKKRFLFVLNLAPFVVNGFLTPIFVREQLNTNSVCGFFDCLSINEQDAFVQKLSCTKKNQRKPVVNQKQLKYLQLFFVLKLKRFCNKYKKMKKIIKKDGNKNLVSKFCSFIQNIRTNQKSQIQKYICIFKKRRNQNFQKTLKAKVVNFRLGFNLKNKEIYRKRKKITFRHRVFNKNFKLFKTAFNFLYKKKTKMFWKKYIFSKTWFEKKKLRFKNEKLFKFPFFFNHLTFGQPKVISVVKNILNNPKFGCIRKGTFRGFFQTLGLKEKIHFFVRSRMYSLFRCFIFVKILDKKATMRLKILTCVRKTLNFVSNILNNKDFSVYSEFYFKKRWYLSSFYNLI